MEVKETQSSARVGPQYSLLQFFDEVFVNL